jgi:Domain of unknown function (DUF4136)
MKSLINLCVVLSAAILLSSCGSGIKISSDYDRTVEFNGYKTYSFYQFSDKGPGLSELNRDRIINSIKKELEKKGLTENNTNPDVLVNATTIAKDKKQVTGTTNYYGYGGYYRPYSLSPGFSGTTTYNVYEYRDGSLIIDFIDANTKKLVWQGTGNKEIDVPLKNAETLIPEAVTKILAGFPPKKK